MRKNDIFIDILFILVVLVIPAFLMYLFILPDWSNNKEVVKYSTSIIISIGYGVGVIILSIIFAWLKIISIESLSYVVPMAIIFALIQITYPLNTWSRYLIIIPQIVWTIPVRIIISKLALYK